MAESENFRDKELACPCCGVNKVELQLLAHLETIRENLHRPIFVTSGYRCKAHNKKVGGSQRSSHLDGFAVDISVISNTERYELVRELIRINAFRGLGIYHKHIHADIKPRRTRLMWWG